MEGQRLEPVVSIDPARPVLVPQRLVPQVGGVKVKKHLIITLLCCIAVIGAAASYWMAGSFAGMWVTPEQQWQRHVAAERFTEAAKSVSDPLRKGAALYLGGYFREAAAVFVTIPTEQGGFNAGNSYMLLGNYDQAIASYEQALELRPDWNEARENLELARLRKERMAPPEDDYGGTGGKLGADEIVLGDRKPGPSSQTVDEDLAAPLSAMEQQALWLRKVQTKPADFLRLKFSYQLMEAEK